MELDKLYGISDKRKGELNKLSIFNSDDLIKHFPKHYLDLSTVQTLQDAYNNDMVLIRAKIVTFPQSRVSGRRNMGYVKVTCVSGDTFFDCIWFNQPYVLNKLKFDVEYLFYGRLKKDYVGATLSNPSFEELEKNYRLKGFVPVYKVGGLSQGVMSSSIRSALKASKISSAIPFVIQRKYALSSLESAYYKVHFPNNQSDIKVGGERIALEEYYTLMCAFKLIKGGREKIRQNTYSATASDITEFVKRFNYELTNGQKSAINDIFSDLKNPHIMNRLLQGDVGSGKTSVAQVAMFIALFDGYQVAYLCPTEILAEQNYNLCKKIFPEYEVALLTSSVKAKEKREIKSRIESGEIKIVVGTHAVLQDDVVFSNLSLVVCDEQHRFGVAHRTALSDKGNGCDTLVMSATPIPRTFSLVFYGDLDISEILDKPKQRGLLDTHIVPATKYDSMLDFIDEQMKKGGQVYFVCPKIEDDEEGELMSVTELYEKLSVRFGKDRLALLHGKMKDSQKNEIMSAFKRGEICGLVSTTVIEVGIDVPNATVMVIFNAERFGLSQLHQLRGRVGRGMEHSYCFLFTDVTDDESVQRLKVIRENTDGFKIAEEDFNMRGGGDFLGTRQSGALFKELGNLTYGRDVVFMAKRICEETFANPEHADMELLKKLANEKYGKLKDVTLN